MTAVVSQSPTPGCLPTDTPGDVDIPEMREKYRADGSTQYLELTGDFAAYSEVDPHTPYVNRDPLSIETDVVILGGTQPEFVYRRQRSVGDLVIWDNTGTMHRALPYNPDSGRLLTRTKLAGEEPLA